MGDVQNTPMWRTYPYAVLFPWPCVRNSIRNHKIVIDLVDGQHNSCIFFGVIYNKSKQIYIKTNTATAAHHI